MIHIRRGGASPKRHFFILLATVAILLVPGYGQCFTPENSNQVAAAVKAAAIQVSSADASITIGTLAGAHFMQSCAAPLSVTISGDAPYMQAAVRCSDPAWLLYVPVTVAQVEKVEVAAHPISAGQTISKSDVDLQTKSVSLIAGRHAFFNEASLIGATASMSLEAGQIFTDDNIQEPVIVTAGQTVSVSVISGGVLVSVMAVADETGRIGDTILMTNPSSGKRFSAQITATGPVLKLSS